jgi:hypothetical protein
MNKELVMLKWIIRNRLAAFEKAYNYDVSYARDLLATDTPAFLRFAKVSGLSSYRRDVPKDVYYAVKITGTLAEDCGPCSQLVVTWALKDGVDPHVIATIVEGTEAMMSEPVRLGVRFARAVLAHSPDADDLRDDIVRRWGPRALVSLAFALTSARIYPTLKYAMGYGKACQRIVIAGETVTPPAGRPPGTVASTTVHA